MSDIPTPITDAAIDEGAHRVPYSRNDAEQTVDQWQAGKIEETPETTESLL